MKPRNRPRGFFFFPKPGTKKTVLRCPAAFSRRAECEMQTAQQYLLSQAEHCRRTASDCADPEIAEELRQLAAQFDREARAQFAAAGRVAPIL
jgi:hypothetical protein